MLKERADDLKPFVQADDEKPKKRKKPTDIMMERLFKLVSQGLKLGVALGGGNTTSFDDKEKRVLSPRFFGVNKDRDEDKKVRQR